MFSQQQRCHYRRSPLSEVICQLRFPEILSISANPPAAFQEAIRDDYPEYTLRRDVPPPKVTGAPGHFSLENPPTVVNYQFASCDGVWRVNLTGNFISLSCTRYPGWEEFAARLDKPLAAFIRLYKPAYFQRVGLRYLNLISRQKLGLEGIPWTELIAPAYTGPLQEEDVAEDSVLNCGCDLLLKLDSSCQAKIHAGPGHVKNNAPNAPQDPEEKFIFDMDLSMNGQTPCTLAAAALETLHGHSTRLFEGAVTDRLRRAMEPR